MLNRQGNNVGIGTTQTAATLITTSTTSHAGVGIADGYLSIARDLTGSSGSGGVAFFNRLATDGPIADFRVDGSSVGSIGNYSNTGITIGNGSTYLGIASSNQIFTTTSSAGLGNLADGVVDLGFASSRFKDLYLSGGVVFGTTVGAVTSKTLDDYEEGTWTPTLTCSTTNPTIGTYSNRVGTYTKIGNLVTATCFIRVTVSNVGSGYPIVSGLPFSAVGDLDGVATGLMNLCPTTKGHGGDAYVNSSAILFTNEVLATATGSGNYMTFSVTYRTNS